MSNINDWLLANYPKEQFTPGFERISNAVNLLELSPIKSKVITVAGTNGKGTVSNLLFNNINANAQSAAVFCSPHLVSITERFKFSDLAITEDDLLNLFVQTHTRLSNFQIELSFYEFTLVCFLYLCKIQKSQYIILEVGIGGRLDATSVISADVGVITSISRDHTELLGKTYQLILKEKLGIAKSKTQIFASFDTDYLVHKAKQFLGDKKIGFNIIKDSNDLQSRNKFVVSQCLEYFNLSLKCFSHLSINKIDKFFYSCCHNLSAVRNLVNSLILNHKAISSNSLILLSYSHRDIKELEYMSKLFLRLKPFVADICLTHIDQFKAASIEDLKTLSDKLDITFIDEENLINVVNKNKKIYLSGSNYFIGSFISRFG